MKKTTILFDITGVLFWENKLKLARSLGLSSVMRYLVTHRSNPMKACFALLERMRLTDTDTTATAISYKKNPMPQCMSQWQQGDITSFQLKTKILNYLEKADSEGFFKSRLEKRLVKRMITVCIDPHTLAAVAKPNKRLIRLIKKLKKQGTYQLIIVSNMAHETYQILSEKYPELLELFEGIVISAEVGLLKPDKAMYQYVLDTYALEPENCLFVDDQEDNIVQARELGISGIIYKRFGSLKAQMRQLGMLN